MKLFNLVWSDGTTESWPIKSFCLDRDARVIHLELDKLDDTRKNLSFNLQYIRAWWSE